MLVIIFSSFVVFASILVDTFSSSFIRFSKLFDDTSDFNRFPQINIEDQLVIYLNSNEIIYQGWKGAPIF